MSTQHEPFPAHKNELRSQSFVPEDVVIELSRICGQITNGWEELGRYAPVKVEESPKVEELPEDKELPEDEKLPANVLRPLNLHEEVAMHAILRSAQGRLLQVSAPYERALQAGAESHPQLAFIAEEVDLAKQLLKLK